MVDYALEFIFEGDVEDAWGEYYDEGSDEDEYESSFGTEIMGQKDSLVPSRAKSERELIVPRPRYESFRTRMRKEQERQGAIRGQEMREKLRKLMGMKARKDADGESIKTELSFEATEEKKVEESSSEDSSHLCLQAIDISDSQLTLSDESDALRTEEISGAVPTFKDDGIDKFFYLVKEMKLRPISSMKRMLQSDTINLRYYGIDPRVLQAIAEATERNPSVQTIDLTDNWLTVDACFYLSELLLSNNIVSHLDLSGCRIGPDGAKALHDGIAGSSALSNLNLSRCYIGDDGLEYLTAAICQNEVLENLNLMNNSISDKGAQCLSAMLEKTKSLKRLDLSWNRLWQGTFGQIFFEGLSKNSSLEYLNMSGNGLGEDDATFLSSYLAGSTNLREFDLSSNHFGETDAIKIAGALSTNNGLEIIRLGNNPLKASGASALVNILIPKKSPNLQLKLLDLENVWVEKDIVPSLEIIQRERPSLKITIGGILSNYKLHGPDLKKIFLKRANYEAMNTKKKKQSRNFGHFVLSLNDEVVSSEIFKEAMKKFKLKLSQSLVDELVGAFDNGAGEIDLVAFKKFYLKEYPETELPPSKPMEKRKKNVRIKVDQKK